jgi:hypothetical protein
MRLAAGDAFAEGAAEVLPDREDPFAPAEVFAVADAEGLPAAPAEPAAAALTPAGFPAAGFMAAGVACGEAGGVAFVPAGADPGAPADAGAPAAA